MNFKRFAKQATVVTLSTAILLGAGESLTYAKEKDSRDHNESYGISHMTRSDMYKMIEQQNDPRYTVPQFDESKIKNITSAKGYDELGKLINLDVWDTWPLQNADGTVANYNGYQIVFGLAGDPDRGWDTFIYMFYKKIGDTGIDSWKNAGRVFKDSDKFKSDDQVLRDQAEEWSGSATFTEDGKVRLFYTNRQGWDPANNFFGKQTLTTAQVNVSEQGSNTLKVDGIEDHKSIFDGDKKIYQTVEQAFGNGDYSDNHTLRDPHYIEENGHKYLVFEANTGTETGYQGEESLFNKAYYGTSESFFQNEKSKLLQSSKKDLAQISNGALGIIEINDDYTLKRVMKPLVTSNTVTDEIERPNIFKKDGKWYLFTSSRGSKMTIDGIDNEDIYLLGYVSNSLTGTYKPLNKTGLVLHHDLDPYDVTWNYAHFAIPQEGSDNTVVTSYMTNRGYFEDHKSTFAPSFQLNIKGDKTSVVKNSILEQGQVTVK
ncbi:MULTISPECIES: glycoside hydrolase family 68 protein [Metabacillus]|uniref:Levansucrase n=2 Tax=Metabacillus TaxID=2675233 RepID=A0A179T2D2_9BACI|nr:MULTISPECIES: glycoside hydrolase family 68 protein [Metabacillus]OAS87824.1 levansucrase [Metabacillus litoralis]QNF27323.1 glycoside hydrolase family 68 protein [Metabacillus sp. KUDC1714]